MDMQPPQPYQSTSSRPDHPSDVALHYPAIVARICAMRWSSLGEADILRVAQAYHYFSIQFRENLNIARGLHPEDINLRLLYLEECDTANLSPWPGVAEPGEKLDHDLFMDRLLRLQPVDGIDDLRAAGDIYLAKVRGVDDLARAKAIASYEDRGLSDVFTAILQAPSWEGPALRAFQHFLLKHVEFDSDNGGGHGVLSRTLVPDDSIIPLWAAFETLLCHAVPAIAGAGSQVL